MASLVELAKKAEKFTVDNSPLILTAIGTAGVVTTAFLTGRAAFKAAEVIEGERYKRSISREAGEPTIELTLEEKARLTWTLYIPAVTTCVLTCGAVVGANRIGSSRAAALAAAYTISEKAYDEYRDKVREKFGEKKEQTVVDEVLQDRVTRDYDENKVVIIEGMDQLCYDSFSGRFFNSNVEDIRHAVNVLNQRVINNGYASLSDFYDYLELPPTAASEEVGWNTNRLADVYFGTTLAPSGKAAIALEYRVMPIRDYFQLS